MRRPLLPCWSLALVALATSGCHAYQRDPRYALARLVDVVQDPVHPNNVPYALAALALGLLALLGVGAIVSRARRAKPGPRDR